MTQLLDDVAEIKQHSITAAAAAATTTTTIPFLLLYYIISICHLSGVLSGFVPGTVGMKKILGVRHNSLKRKTLIVTAAAARKYWSSSVQVLRVDPCHASE